TYVRGEVRIAAGGDAAKPGDQVLVSIFADGERVDVIGTSRGKGFQGVIKRHHFAGGAATHGSMFHRAPGSIGASSFPSRVVKGMRAAGRMGADRVTTRNLKVVSIDADNHLLVLRGAVPGAPNGVSRGRQASDRVRAARHADDEEPRTRERERKEAVRAEGHRPSAGRLDADAAVAAWRHGLRTAAAQLRLHDAEEGRARGPPRGVHDEAA